MIFHDRKDAGQQLAHKLSKYKNDSQVVVLALPRGGVVTAFEIAKELHVPLDITVPRKIGAPKNPEFAIGAINEEGRGVFDLEVILEQDIGSDYLYDQIEKERKEAKRRLELYRDERPSLELEGKKVILVDDGVATGSTMRAAIASIRSKKPEMVVVAVPVIALNTFEVIQKEADEVVALHAPRFFMAVGQFYQEFEQTDDEEVVRLLEESWGFESEGKGGNFPET